MFRYILVPASGADTDEPVFRAALVMARATVGHLAFLHVCPDVENLVISMATGDVAGTAGIGDLMERLEQDAAAGEALAKQRMLAFCGRHRITLADTGGSDAPTAEWRSATGDEARLVAAQGRAADLTVLGRVRDDDTVMLHLLHSVLLDSGRPMLIAPARPVDRIGVRIAIAWKDTPEAARAVAAALPMLPGADAVTVVSVEEDARTAMEACDLLRHSLSWHNRATAVRHVRPGGREPVEALLAAVADLNADLLVMGGYSHSRVREIVFGGFTRRVLRAADVPVLMAH